MTLTVLCLNDYPVGIYSSQRRAESASVRDWKRREPRWQQDGLSVGEAITAGHKHVRYFYHYHDFEVDA